MLKLTCLLFLILSCLLLQAYVRFHEEGKAVEVVQILTAMEDLVMMDNCFFSVRVLEG